MKNLLIVMAACAVIPWGGSARVLPKTLVVSQCEFYPLREQPRGLLGRYTDQPLFVNPDLPHDVDREGIPAHPQWGSFHSQADWEAAQQLGKDYGLDGFSFFPADHRRRYWRAIDESKVGGFLSVPVVTFMLRRLDEDIDAIGRAIESRGGYRYQGKTLVLSYWTDRVNTPARLKEKLSMARKRFGDKFLYVTDITAVCNVDEYLTTGRFSEKTLEQRKNILRDYLRVSDGIYVGDTFSLIKFDRGDRLFDAELYQKIIAEMKSVLEESEFAGRKLLGLSALMAHENATLQFWTPRGDGLRTLVESMKVAIAAQPDVLVLPEWDEFNENTSFCPTLYNGWTTKRVVRHLLSTLHGVSQTVLPGDDVSRPNLIVSYRKNLAPGERFFIDILNVPDGARHGELKCRAELTDDLGRVLVTFPLRKIDEGLLESVRYEAPSEELARRTRTVGVRLCWVKNGKTSAVKTGFHPIEILAGSGWNLREVRQAIRDLAPMKKADVSYEHGTIRANLMCGEPIRYAFVTGNGWIQYVAGNEDSAAARFREDATNAVFKVDGYSFHRRDGDFAFRVEGSDSPEWFDWRGVTTGETFRTDWVYSVGEPVYLKLRKDELEKSTLKVDFPGVCRETIPLKRAFDEGAYVVGTNRTVMFSAVRFARQGRYPSPLNSKACLFSMRTDSDCKSMAYNVQVVTMSGKTWRSAAFVDEARCGRAKMKVYSVCRDQAVDLELPASRIPVAAYDFSGRAGLYLPISDGTRRMATTLGGPCSIVSLWNRCSSSRNDFPEGLPIASVTNSIPRRVTDCNGCRELVFDGVDDFVTFPWEIVPRGASFRISLDIHPDETYGAVALLTSKNLLSLWLEDGEVKVRYSTGRPQSTGLVVEERKWNHVEVSSDCERLSVAVNGRHAAIAARAPAAMSSSLAFAAATKSNLKPFKGRLRNLVFDQALERE